MTPMTDIDSRNQPSRVNKYPERCVRGVCERKKGQETSHLASPRFRLNFSSDNAPSEFLRLTSGSFPSVSHDAGRSGSTRVHAD